MATEITVADWLKKADKDWDTATIITLQKPDFKDIICFHYQQCAEKYLKALLLKLNLSIPRTHNLKLLLDIISEHIVTADVLYDAAELVQSYAVEVRYPQSYDNEASLDSDLIRGETMILKNWVMTHINT